MHKKNPTTSTPRPLAFRGGFSIVEIIVASAIIITVVTAAVGAWVLYLNTSTASARMSQAAMLIEEGSEVLRLFRDQSWSRSIALLNLGTDYQLSWANNKFNISTNQTILQNQFVRTFTLSAVSRNASDDIVVSGTDDPNTRKVLFSVFLVGATSTPIMQTEMLIHNVNGN